MQGEEQSEKCGVGYDVSGHGLYECAGGKGVKAIDGNGKLPHSTMIPRMILTDFCLNRLAPLSELFNGSPLILTTRAENEQAWHNVIHPRGYHPTHTFGIHLLLNKI